MKNCPLQISEYTSCVLKKEGNLGQHDCQREYEKLSLCIKTNMKK